MNWLSQHFDASELGAVDTVLHKVAGIYKADSKMQAIFGENWIKSTDLVNRLDFSHFPVFFISPFNSTMEPVVSAYNEEFRLYLTTRFKVVKAQELDDLEATLATYNRYLHSVMERQGNKSLGAVVAGNSIELVRRNSPGPMSFEIDEAPEKGLFVVTQVIERIFESSLDPTTGRIKSVVWAEAHPNP